jgi:hypothetical protein
MSHTAFAEMANNPESISDDLIRLDGSEALRLISGAWHTFEREESHRFFKKRLIFPTLSFEEWDLLVRLEESHCGQELGNPFPTMWIHLGAFSYLNTK